MKNIDYVDLFHATMEQDLPTPQGIAKKWFFLKAQTGNCIPGAVMPFSAVSVCAYTGGYPTGYGPYKVNTKGLPQRIMSPDKMYAYGLSHFHQSGTGDIEKFYNYFITTPSISEKTTRFQRFPLQNEKAEPGYYSCNIGDVLCETTVTYKASAERFTFPCSDGCIFLDLSLNGLINSGKPMRKFGVVKNFNAHKNGFSCTVLYEDLLMYADVICDECKNVPSIENRRVKMNVENKKAEIYIGFSFSSHANAVENSHSAYTIGFEKIKTNAYNEWDRRLSAINIEADDRTKNIFYSCLYHMLVKPVKLSDDSPHNGISFLDFNTMWDMYKAQLPLIFSVYKDIGDEITESILNTFEKIGYMPICLMLTSLDKNCDSQARALSCLTLYDAYKRGVAADGNAVLNAMIKELERSRNQDFFENCIADEFPSHTMDLACACYSVSLLAEELGKHDIALKYEAFSTAWKNVFDKNTSLCVESGTYYEGSNKNYSFRFLPHMSERVNLNDNFVDVLDSFFGYGGKDAVQLKGKIYTEKQERIERAGESLKVFEGFNNETDMETPYAYLFAGRFDRTAEIVRAGLKYMYSTGRGGLCGNDDSGGMSSSYVSGALGLFPVSGQPIVLLGSPCVDKAEILLNNGKKLNVIAENNSDKNIYPVKVYFNDKERKERFISVDELMDGGTVKFIMSDKLN
jgi:predicted alpha-1,2-mannosidase